MRFLRLTGVNARGEKLAIIVNINMIALICENTEPGSDKRPLTNILLHGCQPIYCFESVDEVGRLMNIPDSMSGPLVNPVEIP